MKFHLFQTKPDLKPPSNELEMSNVGGMFLVLMAGCAVAFFVSILEFLWNVRKIAVEEQVTPLGFDLAHNSVKAIEPLCCQKREKNLVFAYANVWPSSRPVTCIRDE